MRRDVCPGRCIWDPHFRGRWGHMGSSIIPFERAMVVSYRLSIVTFALSLTIRPQFAIEYLRCSNQQGLDHSGAKFGEQWADRCKSNFKMI